MAVQAQPGVQLCKDRHERLKQRPMIGLKYTVELWLTIRKGRSFGVLLLIVHKQNLRALREILGIVFECGAIIGFGGETCV